jgi:putative glutamine amidotransferase
MAGDKYLQALARVADVIPVLVPFLSDYQNIEQWLNRVDGIFLTGAYSMVDPLHYGEDRLDRIYEFDASRDALSFALVRSSINHDIPILGVCRGLQDINVALGGSLHQAVHEQPGLSDHREDKNSSLESQYGDAHRVNLVAGGLLENITGREFICVNSLHSQGINQLADGLAIEAKAEDGLIEAFRINQLSFGLAVQWHPEWRVTENPIQQTIFEAFGQACRKRLADRK